MKIQVPTGNCVRVINDKTLIVDDFEYTLVGTEWVKVRELSDAEISGLSLYQCHAIAELEEYAQWSPVYSFIGFSVALVAFLLFVYIIRKVF